MKKGTEKPIEIFVALFIILAVAMLMLKMFQGQLSTQSDRLKAQQDIEAMETYLSNAQRNCDQLCEESRESGCSLKSMARYCLETFHGRMGQIEASGYDLNSNNEIDESAVDDVGFAYCEDQVYCSQRTEPPCGCKGGLTFNKCKEVFCEYFAELGLDPNQEIEKRISPGECTYTENDNHWYDVVNLTCET